MARITILFGVLLIIVGVIGFVATGSQHYTALIPAAVGLLFIIFGSLASGADQTKRKLWMHIAVTIGLLGFLGTFPAVVDMFRMLRGVTMPSPIKMEEKAAMSLLCLAFVLLCVRSFITARRNRTA
jgi:hypothetical protein